MRPERAGPEDRPWRRGTRQGSKGRVRARAMPNRTTSRSRPRARSRGSGRDARARPDAARRRPRSVDIPRGIRRARPPSGRAPGVRKGVPPASTGAALKRLGRVTAAVAYDPGRRRSGRRIRRVTWDLTAKPASEARVTLTQLMEVTDANVAGNVHGGVVMRLADTAGALAAMRHAGGLCVTVTVDEISFLEPVHVGDVLTLHASVNDVGTTSLEAGVRVETENPITGRRAHAASAYLVFVALDDEGRPRPGAAAPRRDRAGAAPATRGASAADGADRAQGGADGRARDRPTARLTPSGRMEPWLRRTVPTSPRWSAHALGSRPRTVPSTSTGSTG